MNHLSLLFALFAFFSCSFPNSDPSLQPLEAADPFPVDVLFLENGTTKEWETHEIAFLGLQRFIVEANQDTNVIPIPLAAYQTMVFSLKVDLNSDSIDNFDEAQHLKLSVSTLKTGTTGYHELFTSLISPALFVDEPTVYNPGQGILIDFDEEYSGPLVENVTFDASNLPTNNASTVSASVSINVARELTLELFKDGSSTPFININYPLFALKKGTRPGETQKKILPILSSSIPSTKLLDINPLMEPYFYWSPSTSTTADSHVYVLTRGQNSAPTSSIPSKMFRGYLTARTFKFEWNSALTSVSNLTAYIPTETDKGPFTYDFTVSSWRNPLFGGTENANQGGVLEVEFKDTSLNSIVFSGLRQDASPSEHDFSFIKAGIPSPSFSASSDYLWKYTLKSSRVLTVDADPNSTYSYSLYTSGLYLALKLQTADGVELTLSLPNNKKLSKSTVALQDLQVDLISGDDVEGSYEGSIYSYSPEGDLSIEGLVLNTP